MSAPPTRRLIPARPPELLLYDEPGPCPYLPEERARLPLRLPVRPLTRDELDARLRTGDRRQGLLLYRTECGGCQACEPIRVDVHTFEPRRTQRRILRRGNERVRIEIGPPVVDEARVELYNQHKRIRGLAAGDTTMDADGFRAFLVDTCCETFEMRYWVGAHLMGVAVVDRGAESLSAVYFFFDPQFERLSPGVFSILQQIELCRRWGLRYLYLGLHIARCPSMVYKAGFHPHERLIDGEWQRFDD